MLTHRTLKEGENPFPCYSCGSTRIVKFQGHFLCTGCTKLLWEIPKEVPAEEKKVESSTLVLAIK